MVCMKSATTSKAMVQVSINTFDNGDETVVFRTVGDKVTVKEHGKAAREIEFEAAVKWMTEMTMAKWGVTSELKEMPAWAV